MPKKNFRLLGIKTGDSCIVSDVKGDINFLKSLKPNTFYPFYNDFNYDQDSKVISYKDNTSLVDLYSTDKLKINISAIVGENGSGKSTLIELLLLGVFNISAYCDLLFEEPDRKAPLAERIDPKQLFPLEGVSVEVLFEVGNTPKIVIVKGNSIKVGSYLKRTNEEKDFKLSKLNPLKKNSGLKSLFYSILINYSHYSLNSLHIGSWVKSLFHKNDGYQTPVVINPMRSEGNIDINVENYLLISRLLSNILEPIKGDDSLTDTLRNLSDGKLAIGLKLSIDRNKVIHKYARLEENQNILRKLDKDETMKPYQEYYDEVKENYKNRFDRIIIDEDKDFSGYALPIKEHFGLDITRFEANNELAVWGVLYLVKKIRDSYYKYFVRSDNDIIDTKEVVELFRSSESHVAFKIKQAVYFLKHLKKWRTLLEKEDKIDLDKISSVITVIKNEELTNEIKSERVVLSTIELIPPPFLEIEIILKNDIKFNSLSSGEKQKIHSVSSIVYHLINLNSVSVNKGLIKYKSINIIFDEIELYYHPNWQRSFIYDLLDYLKKVNPKMLGFIEGINFMFITHSPFILSDIPSNSILRLKEGQIFDEIPIKSFGANIHDMLIDSFFLEDGAKGEFAIQTVREVVDWLNDMERLLDSKKVTKSTDLKLSKERKFEKIKKRIQLIDEPIVKRKLAEMYDDVMKEDLSSDIIQQEIKFLQQLQERIKK